MAQNSLKYSLSSDKLEELGERLPLTSCLCGWRCCIDCDLHADTLTTRLPRAGGSEKKRVRTDYYPNDYEWSSRGPIKLKQV